ncbi:MAG: ABC transporter substrate-binding protein [Phycisphaerales bacterium]
MQNRFTVKDFFYMLIGGVICLLLFLNMVKTDREVTALVRVDETLGSQQQTLAMLQGSIDSMTNKLASGVRIEGGFDAANASRRANGETPAIPSMLDPNFEPNRAPLPSYRPGADIKFAAAADSVNRQGLEQTWQVAPDAYLPDDFAPGDSLIQVWNSEPQTLTPFVARDAYATRVYREVLEKLCWADVDAPYGYTPGLAREWEVSEDGLEITFKLFENATWWDGAPVTADDVIFTFDLVMNEEIDAPVQRSYLGDNVESWTKIDDHTIKFVMKETYFDSVGIVGNLLFMLPKHVYGDFSAEEYNERIKELCRGSGPWVIESWEKGAQLVLTRNENYWGPKPALERHVIRFIQSELPEFQEFKAGNVDLIGPTPEQWSQNVDNDWEAVRGRPAQSILYYSPLGGYGYMGYNLRLPKFADKRTRQALTMLVDRRELIDTLREGIGEIVTGPFHFNSDQYNKNIEPWPFDPDRAMRLLNEVGWEDTDEDGVLDMDLDNNGTREPFEITFLMPSGSSYSDRLQRYVREKFQAAGIKVNLDQLEWSVFEQRLTERDFEMVSLAWTGNPEGDPYQIWHSNEAENRGSNYIGFVNEEADRIIETARRELDYDKRMALWHRFHEILHEEQPYTFLFNRPSLAFLDGRFENVKRRQFRLYVSEWYVPAPEQIR